MNDDSMKEASSKSQENGATPELSPGKAQMAGLQLIDDCKTCLLGTLDDAGFPVVKAMMNLKHEGLKTVWFSTNTSSGKISRLQRNNRASVYFVDDASFRGLLLTGTAVVCRDRESRELLWMPEAERYYPLGVDDPDYSVIRLTAIQGSYYHDLSNSSFTIE